MPVFKNEHSPSHPQGSSYHSPRSPQIQGLPRAVRDAYPQASDRRDPPVQQNGRILNES